MQRVNFWQAHGRHQNPIYRSSGASDLIFGRGSSSSEATSGLMKRWYRTSKQPWYHLQLTRKSQKRAEQQKEEDVEPNKVNCTGQGFNVAACVIVGPGSSSHSAAGPEVEDTKSKSHRRQRSYRVLKDMFLVPIRLIRRYLKKSPASRSDDDIAADTPADRTLPQRVLNIGKPEEWQTNGLQEGTFPEPLTEEEAAEFEDLLAGILKYGPAERMTLDQISKHRWFSKKYTPHGEESWLERWS
jgi:hypothetical protein